jgi:hypothetical protein
MIDYLAAKSHAETTKVSSSAASVNVIAFFILFDLKEYYK